MAKLAFDTGGTFTDFALTDDRGGIHLHKVLSTPANPAEAVIRGAGELLARVNGDASPQGLQVLGATTVVTNAVLERKGVKTAFITTDGFQDMLRIRNEGRPYRGGSTRGRRIHALTPRNTPGPTWPAGTPGGGVRASTEHSGKMTPSSTS